MRAHALLTTVTAGALVLAGAGVAHAEGTSAADAVARDVAQVAPSVDVQDGGSSVTTLPGDTAGAVELTTSNGTLHLGLPGAARRAVGQSAADGTVVYTDAAKSTDVAAQALTDGVRLQTVLQDKAAPSRFTYALPDSPPTPSSTPLPLRTTASMASAAPGGLCSSSGTVESASAPL